MQLFVGREAVIFCNVTGWPPLTVKWLMNGTELKDGDLNISVSLIKEGKKAESIKSSLHFSPKRLPPFERLYNPSYYKHF